MLRCLLAIPIACVPVAVADLRYRVIPCGDLPGGYVLSDPDAINNQNQICRDSNIGIGGGKRATRAFIWSIQTGIAAIDDLPGGDESNGAYGLNNIGHVVGWAGSEIGSEPIFWSPESGTIGLGYLPGGYISSAWGINDVDEVVGRSSASPSDYSGFYWNPADGLISIGDLPGGEVRSTPRAINNAGQVVGESVTDRGNRGFIWTREDGMWPLPEQPGLYPRVAMDINERGQVCGIANTPAERAFLWDPAQGFTLIQPLPGMDWTAATKLNNRAEVVVNFVENNRSRHGLWDARRGLRRIGAADLAPCTPPEWLESMWVRDINDSGCLAVFLFSLEQACLLIPYIPGDLNEDNEVDLADLLALLSRFGTTANATYETGDIDCDADVDLQDLSALLANFGDTYP